jgi:hypothetical protein
MRSSAWILVFVSLFAFAAEPPAPASFRDATLASDAQENDPAIQTYLHDSFNPYYQKNFGPVIMNCFKMVARPDSSPFSFVAVIGKDGRITHVYDDHPTNVYFCLRNSLLQAQFPPPPAKAVYARVHMEFAGMTGVASR